MFSLSKRLWINVRIWALKAFVRLLLAVWRTTSPVLGCEPTLIKCYAVRPKLHNRIYIPRGYVAHEKLLPLYLNIHGGGWTVMDPQVDDEFCSYVANTFGVLVVGIDYHKAPRNPFPGPVEDVAAIVSAILRDESLPIDQTKIAIGGFSAGGNLGLAISQKPEFHNVIKAAVCFYAPVDFSTSVEEKLKRSLRPDRPDMLAPFLQTFEDAYVPEGIDEKNPLLSPLYAARKSLPEWLYVICGELDCLCIEGREFAERMAGVLPADFNTSRETVELHRDSWDIGKVRWEMAKDMMHNFTHLKKPIAEEEKERVMIAGQLYGRIFDWLNSGPWS